MMEQYMDRYTERQQLIRLMIASSLLFALTVTTLAQQGSLNPEVLIRSATILTASHGTIEDGSILIRDGKIVEKD